MGVVNDGGVDERLLEHLEDELAASVESGERRSGIVMEVMERIMGARLVAAENHDCIAVHVTPVGLDDAEVVEASPETEPGEIDGSESGVVLRVPVVHDEQETLERLLEDVRERRRA